MVFHAGGAFEAVGFEAGGGLGADAYSVTDSASIINKFFCVGADLVLT